MAYQKRSGNILRNSWALASSCGALYFLNQDSPKVKQLSHYFQLMQPSFLTQLTGQQLLMRNECWVSDERRKYMQSINTNVFVWGEGQQVDAKQDYSNFTPKNIKNFRGKDKPNIIDIAFGWYHEAYIDSKGKLMVCRKNKQTSVRVKEIDDKDRTDLMEIKLPGNAKVKQAQFTRQRMFVLTEKGDVYVFKIEEVFPQIDTLDHLSKTKARIEGNLQHENPILVKDLPPLKMMATGTDHFLGLTMDGKVYAMGDDTFGQCGQSNEGRSTTAPFFEKRFGKPVLVKLPEKVVKVATGYRHSFAITENGSLFGWGYNNQLQLSHGEEYSFDENPWHAIFTPVQVKKDLEGKHVFDAAGGEEFSIILCKDPNNGNVEEVYACGNNLRGQLGINRVSHLQDLMLVEDVSGFVDQATNKPLHITNVQCGRKHCVLTFEYGAFFMWGDNENGQLGNKKRSFLESPYPKSKFEKEHNVENVVCGIDSCAVIVEDLEGKLPQKKKKKQQKRVISSTQMVTSPEQLKYLTEASIVKKTEGEGEDEFVQRNLGERIREKWHGLIYGSEKKTKQPTQKDEDAKQQQQIETERQKIEQNKNDSKKL